MGFNSSDNSVISDGMRRGKSSVSFQGAVIDMESARVRCGAIGTIYPVRKHFQGNQRQILFPER